MGIEVFNTEDTVTIKQGGDEIHFPKEHVQTVIDAILVVDWAINRRRQTARVVQRRAQIQRPNET